jgi:hypothetical protein
MSGFVRLLVSAALAAVCAPAAAQFSPTDQISRNTSSAISNQVAQRIIRPRLTIRNRAQALQLVASANGRFVAAAFANGLLTIWDVDKGREVVRFSGVSEKPLALANSGRFVLTADSANIYRRDQSGRTRIAAVDGVCAGALMADDTAVAVSSGADRLEIRDVATGSVRLTQTVPCAVSLASAPDGTVAVLTRSDGAYVRWDTRGNATRQDWKTGRPVVSAAIAYGDGVMLVIEGNDVKRVALASGASTSLNKVAERPVSVALTAGAKAALFAMTDGMLLVADSRTGDRLAQLATTDAGWAVVDYSGRFDGNTSGIDAVAWQSEAATLSLDALARKYFEPGMLSNVLTGQLSALSKVPENVSEGVAMPPKVEIDLPKEGPFEAGKPIQLVVIVEDLGGGIDNVRLFHNGKIVNRGALIQTQDVSQGKRKFRALAFSIVPTAGVNTFRASAQSTQGVEAFSDRASASFGGRAAKGKLHLIAIGVNQYGGPIPPLQLATRDAEAVGAQLARPTPLFDGVVPTVLLDGAAARQAILSNLASVAARTKPEDTLVIFLAGHGISLSDKEWLFLPYGADGSSEAALRSSAITAQQLEEALMAAQASRMVLAIDACQAGAAFGAFAGQRTSYMRLLSNMSRDTGIVVYAATQEASASYEITKLGHGIFTYSLLQGLKGEAAASRTEPAITAFDVANYVEKTVPTLSQFYKDKRQDTATFRLGADFPLAAAR